MQLSVQKRGFLVPELNPNHNSCGNERWSFLLGFSSKSVSYIYVLSTVPRENRLADFLYNYIYIYFFFGTQFGLIMFFCMSFFPVLDPR